MTPQQATEWAEANPGKRLEIVPSSGEDRGESTGPYLGWGQALPDDPAGRVADGTPAAADQSIRPKDGLCDTCIFHH